MLTKFLYLIGLAAFFSMARFRTSVADPRPSGVLPLRRPDVSYRRCGSARPQNVATTGCLKTSVYYCQSALFNISEEPVTSVPCPSNMYIGVLGSYLYRYEI